MRCLNRRRRLLRVLLISSATVILILIIFYNPRLLIRDIGYLTRPIWDSPGDVPQIRISHFHSNSLTLETLCRLHGWNLRSPNATRPKVIDATIISVELDLLEIRMRELWDVVDKFIIVEADTTFTGRPKRLFLQENLQAFSWAREKLVAVAIKGELKSHPKKEFDNEILLRKSVAKAVQSQGLEAGDLVIESDIDEIPYKETMQLLKNCEGYPLELHLEMKNYLYSFEFPTGTTNWKPHVSTFTNPSRFSYAHGKRSDTVLVDAGWHCSFCFRFLEDFIFKMTSYSHADRMTARGLIQKDNIQRKICAGEDVFDMLPEAYTFSELLHQMGRIPPSSTTFGIPNVVMEDFEKFSFLLPGGCRREDLNETRTK